MSLNELLTCPDCGGALVINDDGFSVCSECGLVMNDVVFSNKTIRAYTQQDIDLKLQNEVVRSIGSRTIVGNYKDLSLINRKDKRFFYKLNNINKRVNGYEKRLKKGFTILSMLDFNKNILDDAWSIFKKVSKSEGFNGKSIKDVIIACVFYSAKVNNMSITSRDLFNKLNIYNVKNSKVYSIILKNLKFISNIKVNDKGIINLNFIHNNDDNIIGLIHNYGELMNLSQDLINRIVDNSHYIINQVSHGLSTAGYLSALFYHTINDSGLIVSQKFVAEQFKVSTVTLRNRLKELKGLVYLEDILAKTSIDSSIKRVVEKRINNLRLDKISLNELYPFISINVGLELLRRNKYYEGFFNELKINCSTIKNILEVYYVKSEIIYQRFFHDN